jgi:hypothetical protein
LRVVRIVRPKYTCRNCNKVVQAAAPERLIAGGLATPALLAQVMVSKYGDHTPLYRQSQILARHGVDLGRSTLAGWVGGACWWLEALHGRLCKNVFASDHLFADDTPIPVLDPGRGRTKTGRLWVYAREQRPWSGPAPPAAVYLFAPDRKAERPVAHLTEVPIQFRDPPRRHVRPERIKRAMGLLEPACATCRALRCSSFSSCGRLQSMGRLMRYTQRQVGHNGLSFKLVSAMPRGPKMCSWR